MTRIHIYRHIFFVLILLVSSILCSCSQPITVVAAVDAIPSSSEYIDAMIAVNGKSAHEILRMPLNHNRPFTFGYHVPSDSSCKSIVISIAASDASGCRLAVGDSPTTMLSEVYDGGAVPVEVTVQPLSAPDCSGKDVSIISVSPDGISTAGSDLDSQPAVIELFGWGFRSGAVVKFDGIESRQAEIVSGTRVRAQMPDTNGSLNGLVKIDIFNPVSDQDGLLVVDETSGISKKMRIDSVANRNDLLRYTSLGHFRFETVNNEQGSVSAKDLGLGSEYNIDINKDGRPDIVTLADREVSPPPLPGMPWDPSPYRALHLFLIHNNGRVGQRIRVSLPGSGIAPGSLGTGISDLDGDKDIDIFTLVSTMNAAAPLRLVALINKSN